MRRKKHKHTRRAVSFYKVHYGFKEPFKVLLDGNFIHATLEAHMVNLTDLLEKLLGTTVKAFTTRCVSAELRSMGTDTAAAAAAVRSYHLHHCGHENQPISAAECLLAQVGASNRDHWWVATQDKAMQADMAACGSVPCIFASVNGLHLLPPARSALAHVSSGQAAAQAVPEHELRSEALRELPALVPRDASHKIFRRNKAKGPNPLSVKKKVAKVSAVISAKQRRKRSKAATKETSAAHASAAIADKST